MCNPECEKNDDYIYPETTGLWIYPILLVDFFRDMEDDIGSVTLWNQELEKQRCLLHCCSDSDKGLKGTVVIQA